MIITQTPHLVLRQFEVDDARALDQVFGDPEVMRYGPGAQDSAWVRAWLRNCLQVLYPRLGFGPWAVVEKSTGAVIGYCGLFHFSDLGGQPEVEVGYRLARRWWGQGYASEAMLAVRDYAFQVLHLPRLVALIDPHNTASIRVAQKAGLCCEKEVMLPGYTHPDHLYALDALTPPGK